MRVHREIKQEIGGLTLRVMFDVGRALRAFRVGLAEELAGRYLFSVKPWSERQESVSFDKLRWLGKRLADPQT
jgi:hypothetical protein